MNKFKNVSPSLTPVWPSGASFTTTSSIHFSNKMWRSAVLFSAAALVGFANNAMSRGLDPAPTPALSAACEGLNCGAEGMRYKGDGLGVWTYTNHQNKTTHLKVSLAGLQHDQVTVVFSNPTSKAQALQKNLIGRGQAPTPAPFPAKKDLVPTDLSPALQVPVEKRTWQVPQTGDDMRPKPYASTLRSQAVLAGFTYKIWVADSAWTPKMQKNLQIFAGALFGTPSYPGMLKQYVDDTVLPPWGEYPSTPANQMLISPDQRSVNIVFAPNPTSPNIEFFDPDQVRRLTNSNQALVVFAESSGLSCVGVSEGLCVNFQNPLFLSMLTNNLLHELTHLTHFYQRVALRGPDQEYERWLKEAAASSYGYLIASSRFPGTASSGGITGWFSGQYTCPLIYNGGTSDSSTPASACRQSYYTTGQAFLVFLAEQYGTHFYQVLLKTKGTGINALDAAIKESGGPGFHEAFRRWGSLLALADAGKLPQGYGYPGVRVGAYQTPAMGGELFASSIKRLSPLPDQIAPYSHLPLYDYDQSGAYVRELDIPPGIALTVYVQPQKLSQ